MEIVGVIYPEELIVLSQHLLTLGLLLVGTGVVLIYALWARPRWNALPRVKKLGVVAMGVALVVVPIGLFNIPTQTLGGLILLFGGAVLLIIGGAMTQAEQELPSALR